MKLRKLTGLASLLVTFITIGVAPAAYAATSPSLGIAAPYSVLSSSFVNTAPGTTLNGDLGYTTGPAVAVTVNGSTHVADSNYNQAGIDQNVALAALNSQACTYTFPNGPIDLATDTTHGPVGNYTPGVYCTGASSAASIGAGGITLTGSGTYIFRVNGALTTVANSVVTLAGGASACTIWWTPTAATTLGANTIFAGTDIDASGITIGSTVTWAGRALAFGGTVSTNVDTINTVPACSAVSSTSSTSGGGASGVSTASSGGSATPGLPNTGHASPHTNTLALILPAAVLLAVISILTVYAQKRKLSAAR